jgi:uncharacterized protein (TIGR03435 family)
MLQALLAERFQLEVARESREGPVYTLTAPNPRNLKTPANPDGRSLVSTVRDDSNGRSHPGTDAPCYRSKSFAVASASARHVSL